MPARTSLATLPPRVHSNENYTRRYTSLARCANAFYSKPILIKHSPTRKRLQLVIHICALPAIERDKKEISASRGHIFSPPILARVSLNGKASVEGTKLRHTWTECRAAQPDRNMCACVCAKRKKRGENEGVFSSQVACVYGNCVSWPIGIWPVPYTALFPLSSARDFRIFPRFFAGFSFFFFTKKSAELLRRVTQKYIHAESADVWKLLTGELYCCSLFFHLMRARHKFRCLPGRRFVEWIIRIGAAGSCCDIYVQFYGKWVFIRPRSVRNLFWSRNFFLFLSLSRTPSRLWAIDSIEMDSYSSKFSLRTCISIIVCNFQSIVPTYWFRIHYKSGKYNPRFESSCALKPYFQNSWECTFQSFVCISIACNFEGKQAIEVHNQSNGIFCYFYTLFL